MTDDTAFARSATVRAATPADLEPLAGLFNAYRMFYGQPNDMVRAREFLSERMARHESVIFVADAAAQGLVGFTQLYPVFSSVSAKPAWILNDLFVDPRWRRRGVAASLLGQALQHGRENGAAWVSLQTAPDNLAAQALYRQFGFVLDGTYLNFSFSY